MDVRHAFYVDIYQILNTYD